MKPLSPSEIPKMRAAGRLAARTLEHAGKFVRAGITTDEINKIVHDFTLSHGAVPAPLGYHGFPKSVCTSVNDCICHGVPDATVLKDGDIINVDVTCILDGYYGDTSATYFVGEVSDLAKDITDCAQKAMWKGIEEVRPFAATGDIGFAIEKFVNRRGYYVVREIGGHGIGKVFHDDPFVPSHGKKGRGPKLQPWCCITVEPMINQTSAEFEEIDIPNSSIKYYLTGDRTLSAQFEHTVLITDTGYEIMTLP
ncbi:MAG: type I methionyl aminopeptidase [Bdellovibrionales bacterium]|nr:type I methionyl aminopeptidase [Bdellovibrionales bacterium]